MAVHIIGVRHHSPACARLVQERIRELRPGQVLIEGPADMNDRMGELLLDHALPIAIFSYFHGEERYHASWTPFCEYSPEWVALREGRAVGATLRFIDLPAWTEAFSGVRNRYADTERHYDRMIRRLCAEVGMDGMDALWDHLFEQELDSHSLESSLREYFQGMRENCQADPRDEQREAFMADCIAAAVHACGEEELVVVCGGFHKPALERLWRESDCVQWPSLPGVRSEDQQGSYLVPYTFKRLDSFVGYEAGMPSPAYYQTVWRQGLADAADVMKQRIVTRLREREQPVSTADLVSAELLCRGLARLRGHAHPARCDLLDGMASALVKEAQDTTLPWAERGMLSRGAHPVVVEMVAAMSGDCRGSLAAGTPRPPLLGDVMTQLDTHRLVPEDRTRAVELDLTVKEALERSRVLHRLRVLGIPGFVRQSGPSLGTEAVLGEVWSVGRTFEMESAVIEAGAYGATLERAAASRLEEAMLAAAGRVDALAGLLVEATFVGIGALSQDALKRVAALIHAEPDFGKLGIALSTLLGLFRHDDLFGSAGNSGLGQVIESAFERALWLVEGMQGATAVADATHLRGMIAIRDTVRYGSGSLAADAERARDVMQRRATDVAAPPAIRGASLGMLWSLGMGATWAEAEVTGVICSASRPSTVGDFLAGLFALAREEVLIRARSGEASLVRACDELLEGFSTDDFLIALPPLRLAFSYFPPREREAIARLVLGLHGGSAVEAHDMVQRKVDAGQVAVALALEERVDGLERRYGLGPERGEGK